MDKKKSFGDSLETFFAGKGFYVVLFLCVAVIGISAWSMLTVNKGEKQGDTDISLEQKLDKPEAANTPVGKNEFNQVIEPVKPSEAPKPEPTQPVALIDEEEAVPVAATQDYYIWPVSGQVEQGYAMDMLVFNQTMRDWRAHDGVDIAAEMGTQVKAAANGRVESVYNDDLYGTTVVISHGGGLKSVYSNLAGTPTVAAGDAVGIGQVIGSVGDTALVESGQPVHLHFAMSLNGESVDPTAYMP